MAVTNNYYTPRSGNIVDSNNNIKNEADGLGLDGSRLMGISDGTTTKAMLGNIQGTLLPSAARTATLNTPNQTNQNARGLILTLDITVASGTGGITPIVLIVDPVTGKTGGYVNGLGTPITATGTYTFIYYPNATNTNVNSNVKLVASVPIPKTFIVQMYHMDATSYTYSLGYEFIL